MDLRNGLKKRNSYLLVVALAAILCTVFSARSYISFNILNKTDSRITGLTRRTSVVERDLKVGMTSIGYMQEAVGGTRERLGEIQTLLDKIQTDHAAMRYIELEQRIAKAEAVLKEYAVIFDLITSNDIKILEKLQEEIKDKQPMSKAPDRTALSLVLASKLYDLDIPFLAAVAQVESTFNPQAKSSANAQGLMQLMPSTWKSFRGTFPWDIDVKVTDPLPNAIVSAKYLSGLADKYRDNMAKALQHYNGGPARATNSGAYSSNVLAKAKLFTKRWGVK